MLWGKSGGDFLQRLRHLAFNYYYSVKPKNIFSPILNKQDENTLKKVKTNQNINVIKPDKNRGVVILNTDDCNSKMYN